MNEDEYLNLEINEENLKFPYVWLRDNCQCKDCFHYSAKSRFIDWSIFDVDVKPKDVIQDEDTVQVTWEDGHKSEYQLDWLKFRGFTPKHQRRYKDTIYKPTKITWTGEEFTEICSKHDYENLLESDEALYYWIHNLAVFGVTIVENTPHSDTALDKLIEKIGFIKKSHYGVKFTVQHVVNTRNVAYLSNKLQMHIDLPFYEYCAGINMLHCVVQTESKGGENLLTDSFFVADYMKENYPKEYKLLTEIEVEWSDIVGVDEDVEYFKLYVAPVICLDRKGDVTRINFSVPQRGNHFPGPIELVKPWFEAYSLFLELNHRFAARFKTRVGDILVMDNIRMLHGRDGYEDNTNNVRKIIGAYVDWDEVYSKWRCLKVKLENVDGVF